MTIGNLSYWNEIIQKWQQSGCNMTEFCRQEDLSIHTFKYWKYKLACSKNSEPVQQELVKISEPTKLVPVKVTEEVSEIPEFSQSKPPAKLVVCTTPSRQITSSA